MLLSAFLARYFIYHFFLFFLTPPLHNPGTLPNLKTNTRKWNLWKYHFWEWLLLKKSFLLRKELSWRKICWSWGRSWVCPSPIQSLFCLPLFLSLLGWAALQKTKLSWMLIFGRGGGGYPTPKKHKTNFGQLPTYPGKQSVRSSLRRLVTHTLAFPNRCTPF